MKLSRETVAHVRDLVAARLGLDFPEARQADLERGFVRAARTSSASDPEAYLARLATLPEEDSEWARLAGHLTVGETYFFRDRACFDALEQEVLPGIIAARRAEGSFRLRLWSAGCATGEEPYSVAMLLDRLLAGATGWHITILATDINHEALEMAQQGRYREWSLRDTPPAIRDRYFRPRGVQTFELDPRIRRMVTFAPHNLAEDSYPSMVTNTSAMDVIVSRNVLMYFTYEAQRATMARFARALVPGGWLVVAPAEASADLLRPLVPVNFPGAILCRKGHASAVATPLPAARPEQTSRQAAASFSGIHASTVPLQTPCGLGDARAAAPPDARPDRATLLRRARTLADRGELEGARDLCEAALARDRIDADAHLLLAAICQELGDVAGALEALRRALYLAPDSAPAHFLLGSLLYRRGHRTRGRRSMEAVVYLLSVIPPDRPLPGTDGLAAGRLLETARAYLQAEAGGQRSGAGDGMQAVLSGLR